MPGGRVQRRPDGSVGSVASCHLSSRDRLAVIADQKPTAEWSENPGRASGSQQTRLPWRASDDYGVVSLQAELRLRDRADAIVLGCAGMADLAASFAARFGLPVIEGVSAAVKLAARKRQNPRPS